MSAAVGLINVADVQNAGNQHFAYHLPFIERCSTFHGYTDAIEDGLVLFLAACDQRAFLSGYILTSDNKGKYAIDDAFDLGWDGIPIYRHGEHERICFKYGLSYRIELLIVGAGVSALEAGFAGMASRNAHFDCIKCGDLVAFGLCRFDKSIGHGKAIAALAWTSSDNDDLLAHLVFLSLESSALKRSTRTYLANWITVIGLVLGDL